MNCPAPSREHMQLLAAQRLNSLAQDQLLIRPHFPPAGHVQACAPPGLAFTLILSIRSLNLRSRCLILMEPAMKTVVMLLFDGDAYRCPVHVRKQRTQIGIAHQQFLLFQ